jgi:hypothetical protein
MLDSIYHSFVKRVIDDGTLPQIDRLLVVFLFCHSVNQGGEIHLTVRDLGKVFHVSPAAVGEGIERLRVAGYIEAEKRRQQDTRGRPRGKEIWHIRVPALAPLSETIQQEFIIDDFRINVQIRKMKEL